MFYNGSPALGVPDLNLQICCIAHVLQQLLLQILMGLPSLPLHGTLAPIPLPLAPLKDLG